MALNHTVNHNSNHNNLNKPWLRITLLITLISTIITDHTLGTLITGFQTYFSSVSLTPKMRVPTTPDSNTEAIITE